MLTNPAKASAGFARRALRDRSGATAIEYVLIASVLGSIIVAALPEIGNAVSGALTTIGGKIVFN